MALVKTSSALTIEDLQARLAYLDKHIESPGDALKRLRMIQERIDVRRKILEKCLYTQ